MLPVRLRRFLYPDDAFCLRALLALRNVKFNRVAFLQALVAVQLDRAVVHKYIRPIIPANEPIAFSVVEPLDCSPVLRHLAVPFLGDNPSRPSARRTVPYKKETHQLAEWFSTGRALPEKSF